MAFDPIQALVARLVAADNGNELLSIIDDYLNN